MKLSIFRAAETLLGGGIIACPTEGVFGLGCMPDDLDAVAHLLSIKKRDPAKGLILIASDESQLRDWLAGDAGELPDPDPSQPVTWVARASDRVASLVRGDHATIAVRLTTNPTAAAVCDAVDSPIVSTSANFSGQSVVRNHLVLRRKFGACVDYIVPGECGPASGPSEIRDLATGTILRARTR